MDLFPEVRVTVGVVVIIGVRIDGEGVLLDRRGDCWWCHCGVLHCRRFRGWGIIRLGAFDMRSRTVAGIMNARRSLSTFQAISRNSH